MEKDQRRVKESWYILYMMNWWGSSKESELLTDQSKLDKVIEDMKTGDILLFHGQGFWFSYLVEWMTWSEFSHVGMVLKDPTFIDPSLKGHFMLESGTEQFPDAVEHRIHYGVQVVNLKTLLKNYDGRIYIRKLTVPEELEERFDLELSDVWTKIKDLPYDDNPWDLLKVEFGLNWGDMHRTNKFFCSALQTFLYDQMNLFSSPVPWDLICPEDYNNRAKIDKLLRTEVKLQEKVKII